MKIKSNKERYIIGDIEKPGIPGTAPNWPPRWLSDWRQSLSASTSATASDERQQTDSSVSLLEPVSERDVSANVPSSAIETLPTADQPIPPALEQVLQAIMAEVQRRQVPQNLVDAVYNLLNDCRGAAEAGEHDSAWASAKRLERSIPAYLDTRGYR